jgi:DNA-binding phage protein
MQVAEGYWARREDSSVNFETVMNIVGAFGMRLSAHSAWLGAG